MKRVLVYSDEGVSAPSLRQLIKALKRQPEIETKIVKSATIVKELSLANLLIIPGGRDVFYHNALQGKPNQAIRSFVEKGGSYMGLCAGGYYGSAFVEFDKGHPLEVVGKRELAFFPGTAKGPAFGNGTFEYDSEKCAKSAFLHWKKNPLKPFGTYYNGGCFFVDADQFSDTEVLANYADIEGKPAAIIKCRVGSGSVILSGTHPEYEGIMPQGAPIEHHSPHLFDSLLKDLLYKTEPSF